MLSLKVFERSNRDELLEAYRRATQQIVEALVNHSLAAGDESDFHSFRGSLSEVAATLGSDGAKVSDVLVAAGAASTAIQEYNRHAVTALKARSLELQAVIGMLTQTISDVSAGGEGSIARLCEIERRLAKSREIYDIRDLRQQMSDCLDSVREETACRQRESRQLARSLQAVLREAAVQGMPTAAVPDEQAAESNGAVESLVEEAAANGKGLFVAVLMIDRLPTIVSRFGPGAADQVASFCSRDAKSPMRHALRVFAWRGNACVALFDGGLGAEVLERDLLHDSQRRRPMTLEIGQRNVMVQISYSKWCLLPASGLPPSTVVEGMNAFLARSGAAN